MNTKTSFFPSGRSVSRCRADAKQLVKSYKQHPKLTLAQALDKIAKLNGSYSSWAHAMKDISTQPESSVKKTIRIAQQHLLGHALNVLVKKKLIDLKTTKEVAAGYIEVDLFGKKSVINWNGIGYGEIRLSVWWDFDKTNHPQHLEGGYKSYVLLDDVPVNERPYIFGKKKTVFRNDATVEKYLSAEPCAKKQYYKKFVGVTCSCFIERAKGQYLQLSAKHGCHGVYTRSSNKESLLSIPDCIPDGFSITGPFLM